MVASRQKGVVTRHQLLAAGFTRTMIQRRIASGALIPIHRGVYLVGHQATHPLAYETAAIFACGRRTMLSFHTAARLRGLPAPPSDRIHVTVVGRARPVLRGVQVHTITAIGPSDLNRHHGLPITSPSLTILDMAGVLSKPSLVDLLNEARVQRLGARRLVTDAELYATIEAHPKRRGAKALRALLRSERGPHITRTKAERRALNVMRAYGIEPDATQHPVGPYEVDFWFEDERLAVEFDSVQFHDTPKRFVSDRRRTAYLAAQNIQVFPLTWYDVHGGRDEAMLRLRQALTARRRLLTA